MDTGLQCLASAEHPSVGVEMAQRRCDRSGFFGWVLDAHADRDTSTTPRVPVFLSMPAQEYEKPKTDRAWLLNATMNGGGAADESPDDGNPRQRHRRDQAADRLP